MKLLVLCLIVFLSLSAQSGDMWSIPCTKEGVKAEFEFEDKKPFKSHCSNNSDNYVWELISSKDYKYYFLGKSGKDCV